MNSGEKVKHGALWSVLFAGVSLAWIFPIVLVIINSFKQKAYISRNAFSLPTGKAFVGLENYTRGLDTTNFFASFGWTLLITVGSVALILVCTSMCAWWIVRVNNWAAKLLYTLFLFNMIVPFQMVMFTLSKLADMLKLNTPWGLCFVYLGFGAGLAVFIFTGVVKGIPESLEESAMIDGASVPRIFFQIVVPIMKPSIVSVAILQAMWIWNDYLLPYLTLDLGKYKTISVAVQYLKGGYGSVDMGAMMACLVMAIIPIIIFSLICLAAMAGFFFSTTSSVLAGIRRKQRTLGLLQLMGFSKETLVIFPLAQVVLTALLGTSVAIGAYALAAHFLNQAFAGSLQGLEQICRLMPWHFALAYAISVGVSLLAALAPAWQSSKIEPSEVIRDV